MGLFSDLRARAKLPTLEQAVPQELLGKGRAKPPTLQQAVPGALKGDVDRLSQVLTPETLAAQQQAQQQDILGRLQALPAVDFAPTAALTPEQIQMALIGTGSFAAPSRFAGDQASLIAALQARATGEAGPSPAELLLQQQQDDALRQQLALAATVGGRALPAAQRQILQQQAIGAQEALRQAAILRSQEQVQAQGQLAEALGTARGQDIQRQQILSEVERANLQARQTAAIEQARQALAAQQFSAEAEAQRQRDIEAAQQRRRELEAQVVTGRETREVQADIAAEERKAARQRTREQLAGGLLGTIGAAGVAAAGR